MPNRAKSPSTRWISAHQAKKDTNRTFLLAPGTVAVDKMDSDSPDVRLTPRRWKSGEEPRFSILNFRPLLLKCKVITLEVEGTLEVFFVTAGVSCLYSAYCGRSHLPIPKIRPLADFINFRNT